MTITERSRQVMLHIQCIWEIKSSDFVCLNRAFSPRQYTCAPNAAYSWLFGNPSPVHGSSLWG